MPGVRMFQPSPDLPLRDKIAQLLFVRIGSNMPPVRCVEDDEERVERLLKECPVGGLLLFNGGRATKTSLERLQLASKIPMLVASDIERGVGQQVKGYTLFPHAMAFERLGSEAAAIVGEYATALADEARDVGIHITLGPVADANTNPKNPIIATRAYSETPGRAAELSAAYIRAAEAAGVLTTAKHFPGHGHTHKDSHDSLPIVSRSRSELAACELVPFQAAIAAGCSLVMTAHVAYPELDPSGVPATLSSPILQQLLRDDMGFQGVICSDSLLMAGVRDRFSNEQDMALATLSAGVDLLLDLDEPGDVVDYLCRCVDRGTLRLHRIDEAYNRLCALKQRVFSGPSFKTTESHSNAQQTAASLAEKVARDAIHVLDNSGPSSLPLDSGKPLVAILLKPSETAIDPPEQPLAGALRDRFRDVTYVQLGLKADAAAYDAARAIAGRAEQLLLATVVRPSAWHAFGLREQQSEFVRSLTRTRPLVLASLGVPYVLQDYPEATVRVCTYSDVPVSQNALADFLVSKT